MIDRQGSAGLASGKIRAGGQGSEMKIKNGCGLVAVEANKTNYTLLNVKLRNLIHSPVLQPQL